MIYIFDIDNCVADDSWRISRIRWDTADMDRRYHDYHSLAPFDRVGIEAMRLIHPLRFSPERPLVFCTARPDHYRAATEYWLSHALGFPPAHVEMRPAGDHTPSVRLKERQLDAVLRRFARGPDGIAAAFDDRPDVVDMYNSRGVRGSLLAIHDVCAYTPPKSRNQP